MKTIGEFLHHLRGLGITLRAEGEDLVFKAPKGAVTPELGDELRRRKPELLAFLKQAEQSKGANLPPIQPAGRDKSPPLSFSQQRLWFLDQLEVRNAAYNISMTLHLRGALDVAVLQDCFTEIRNRHESLRTIIGKEDDLPVQIIQPPGPMEISVIDFSNVPDQDPMSRNEDEPLRQLIGSEFKHHFELDKSLFRVTLVRLTPEDHVLVILMHHIISDGWSVGIINAEVVAFYEALLTGRKPPLLPLPIQYADYAVWQHEHLGDQALKQQLDFWRENLEGAPPTHQLPMDFPRPTRQTYEGDVVSFMVDDEVTSALKKLSRRTGTSLFMCLYGAFTLLLSRYSGQEDVVVGTPVANRGLQELEGLVGFFVNTLALRADLSGNPSFLEYLERLRKSSLDAFANQDIPFEQVVEALKPERSLSYSPIFQVLFVLQNTPSNEEGIEVSGLNLLPVRSAITATKFELSLTMKEAPTMLFGSIDYNVALFTRDTMNRLAKNFWHLLAGLTADPEARLTELSLMDDEERQQVLTACNQTAKAWEEGADTLTALLVQQVRRTPQATALIVPASEAGERRELTYAALDAQAEQLAARLQDMGVGTESVVGVCCERSVEMVVALLGILKAGAAYLPLDVDHPAERRDFMLTDAGAEVVVTHTAVTPTERGTKLVLPLEQDAEAAPKPVKPAPENAAYVIYTSGSTGQPKGVLNSHRGICNRLLWMQETYGLNADDRVLQKTPYTFDVSVWEFFWPLITGATLVVAKPGGQGDPLYLSKLIETERITTLHFVPSMLRAFLATAPAEEGHGLKRVICSGEALTSQLRDQFFNIHTGIELHNLYGPTEAAIDVTFQPCTADDKLPRVDIGKPITNIVTYIVDPYLNPVPPGAAGELCLGGVGLARGYMGRPALTAERFVPDPFTQTYTDTAGGRLYRTGDLARQPYPIDGSPGPIQYLGRIDFQVKLRGFRIELGEIESALAQHEAVAEACVLLREDRPGDQRLTAYLERAEGTEEVSEQVLRTYLQERLPVYMVPSAFMWLDEFPLTANGKLNRAALPQPGRRREATAVSLPKTRAERNIAAVWKDLLQLDTVSTTETFFEQGGHSLLLVQVFNRLKNNYPGKLELTDLFRFPTITGLAAYLHDSSETEDEEELDEAAPGSTSPIQLNGETAVAIVGMSFRFPGASDPKTFWENLRDGVEATTFFTEEELLEQGVPQELINHPNFVPACSMLEDYDKFDAGFFGITPKDAILTDPQQRLFLEEAWHALEHAGYDPETYPGPIGVFGGVGLNNYLLNTLTNRPDALANTTIIQVAMGNDKDYLATRVAYRLNLKGPCVTVQTACSTALVALHTARQSLLLGDCDMALAGGVTVAPPQYGYLYEEGMLLSPDGHCRSFDADAKGTIFGSGVGLVVLKRLADAIADGDSIYAVVKGSATNNDGSAKVGYTAPSVDGQAAVIQKALANAGVESESVSYIETHGTATPLGDPIEMAALIKAYRRDQRGKHAVSIGSVKSNLGHLDAAAGSAGLIKTVLSLQHGALPPSLHYRQPNPKIDFEGLFRVNNTLIPWETDGAPRRAGVSSFGIGGTNAHAILEQAPELGETTPGRSHQLLTWSARTAECRETQTQDLANHLESNPDLDIADAAYTLHVGRRAFSHRRILVCGSREEAVTALRNPAAGGVLERRKETAERPVSFMFSGQGSQYLHMAESCYGHVPRFREIVDNCVDLLEPHLGLDLRTLLFPAPEEAEAAETRLNHTDMAQPALFVVSYALAQTWMSWGVRPQSLIGHSIGEYVAACLAGVFDLEDALALVAARGRLMASMPSGSMMAVSLAENELTPFLSDRVSLAAVNGPRRCVLSGPDDALEAVERELAAREVSCRILVTSHAFHSVMMAPILEPFTELVRDVRRNRPNIPFLSNVSGDWITDTQAVDPTYWAEHLRGTVRFSQGLSHLLEDPDRLLLEIGPGRALTTFAQQHPDRGADHLVLSSLPHPRDKDDDYAFLLNALGKCWLAGLPINWKGFHAGESRRRIPLPTYPFLRQRFWPEPPKDEGKKRPRRQGGKLPEMEDWFYVPSWQAAPLLAQEDTGEQVCLVFLDDQELGAQLCAQLAAAGHTCVTVSAGERWKRLDEGSYTIDITAPADYEALFEDLQGRAIQPTRIVHGLCITAAEPRFTNDTIQERGYYSLTWLAQAIGKYESEGNIALIILANGMMEVNGLAGDYPEKATMIGPAKVIPQELPNVSCRLIDVVWPQAARPTGRLLGQLTAETTGMAPNGLLALRGNQRLMRGYENTPLPPTTSIPKLRQDGTYLITGGLGGIGFSLARYLAQTVNARLVLTGRAELPPREEWDALPAEREADDKTVVRISRLRELEALGAEVLPVAADAADEASMRTAVDQAVAHFGPIHGIVHSAGLPSGGIIQLKTVDKMAPILAPKVEGTLILDRIFAETPPDFMLLCSSVTGVYGAFGQVDYCAANAFMDVYANNKAAGAGWNTVSVNWDAWLDVGMAAEAAASGWSIGSTAKADKKPKQAASFIGIAPDEGVDAFGRVLRSGLSQVVVSVRDLQLMQEHMDHVAQASQEKTEQTTTTETIKHPRPSLDVPYVAPSTEIEKTLAAVWQECLGISEIGIHDNFFDLGGDSLLATQIVSRVRRSLEINLSLAGLFDEPTILGVAEMIEAVRSDEDEEDDGERERGRL
ncbi:MAG: amino acid adenylation domain-containing protein [Acidobacteriota bacterium]|nr:amino acid adenylation domain-containing protein [Acidobacteriota bacterium]